MKVGLFVDTHGLYQSLAPNKLDFKKLYKLAEGYGHVAIANAYGYSQNSVSFITYLRKVGFKPIFSTYKLSRTPEMICDIMSAKDLDLIIVCSDDGSFSPLTNAVKKEVLFFGIKPSKKLKNCLELSDSYFVKE